VDRAKSSKGLHQKFRNNIKFPYLSQTSYQCLPQTSCASSLTTFR
jgi:hypothetical protein